MQRHEKLRILLAVAFMIILCSCESADKPEVGLQEEESMVITSFSFTHSGMSTAECFRYSAEQTETGVRLYIEELFLNGLVVDAVTDDPILDQLGELAEKHRLDQWNGFDKSSRRVSDGSSFSLSVTLADGSCIYACGKNKFPKGYSEAEQEICALFKDLIERHGKHLVKEREGL